MGFGAEVGEGMIWFGALYPRSLRYEAFSIVHHDMLHEGAWVRKELVAPAQVASVILRLVMPRDTENRTASIIMEQFDTLCVLVLCVLVLCVTEILQRRVALRHDRERMAILGPSWTVRPLRGLRVRFCIRRHHC